LFFTDFDEDEFLGTQDLEKTLMLLTRNELASDEVSLVSSKVNLHSNFMMSVSFVIAI